jgi:4-amino-4-deoxy-L-arabinose transferase-like glycosyltransferase
MQSNEFDTEPRFVALRDAALIVGLQFLLLVFRLGQVPLLGPDEPRYARVAVEMARSHDLVTPTLAGAPWLEKPPLYYWLAAFGYGVAGETESAARWPAVLAALLMTGFSGLVAARLFGASCGRATMLILGTCPLAFAYGRVATMDMLVAAFITGAIGLFVLSILGIAGPSAAPGAWAMMAFAVLAKGPIGFLIPAGVAIVLSISLRRLELRRVITPLGCLLFLIIAGPWFAAIYGSQGFHFVEVFFLNHNLQRFTSTIHNHPGPPYYYLPLLLLGVFPWSGLVALIPRAWGTLKNDHRWVLLAWLAVPLGLFSLAGSKLPGYILPALPPFAIALALAARTLAISPRNASNRIAGLIGLILSAVIVAVTVRAFNEGQPWGRSALAPAFWLLAATFLASRSFESGRRDSVRVLTIGASGFLLLLALVAPPVLDAMESGRRLFLPARGREVLVLGAWRTAWMSGYFYNDGQVREVDKATVLAEVGREPRLVLFGDEQWRQVETSQSLSALKLAQGPRGTVLAKVSARVAP